MLKEIGWRSDLDEELRRFFAGDFVGEAGLRSSLGSQLDKIRDGVNYGAGSSPMTFLGADSNGPAMWTRSDLPARVVDFGRGGLGINRVLNAFRAMQEAAAKVVVEATRAKWSEKFKAEHGRAPTKKELESIVPSKDAIRAAVERARRHVSVLGAFYRPTPPGSMWGLLGFGPYAMVALTTKPVVDAARGWLAEQRDAELDTYRNALARSRSEAVKRIGEWESWRDELKAEARDVAKELESHSDETGTVTRISLSRRERLLDRLRLIPEADAEIATYLEGVRRERIPEIDTEGMIRRKWDRDPTHDELKDALRRICATAKRTKMTELSAAAERLKNEAELAAKREVAAARAAYAAARGGSKQVPPDKPAKKPPGALSRKRQAIIDDFEETVGLR